jgi:hypothetical protein
MNFSFGSDPEFMLTSQNELKSAIGILPKKERAIVKQNNHYYFDNVLAEIAIKPANTKDESIENIRKSLQGLSDAIGKNKFTIKASANYPKKELNCMDAKVAGCSPEWNVYTLECDYPPDEDVELLDGYFQFKTPFRSAGGHIHIGSNMLQDPSNAFSVVRMMDLFLGIPSIFIDTDPTSKARRRIYGHAGSHRTPEYGIEYRTLGNFWFSSPKIASLIYDLTKFSLNFVETKQHERFWSVDEDLLEEDPSEAYHCFGYDVNSLRRAIDTCDKKLAQKFMIFISNYLPENLFQEIEKLSGVNLPDPYIEWKIK